VTQENSAVEHSSVIDDIPNVKVTCRPNMQVAEDPSEALVAGGVCDIQPGPFRRYTFDARLNARGEDM